MLHADRLSKLAWMLAARTDHEGKPKPGYARNVDAIKVEIERLEAELTQEDVTDE